MTTAQFETTFNPLFIEAKEINNPDTYRVTILSILFSLRLVSAKIPVSLYMKTFNPLFIEAQMVGTLYPHFHLLSILFSLRPG